MRAVSEDIRSFWEKRGLSKAAGKLVTHRDLNQVSLEMNTVLDLLNKKDTLLDVGCGNGYATSVYAKKCQRTRGIDFSMNMIEAARKVHENRKLTFELADILTLHYKKGEYNTILSTRCLINLTSWSLQKKAIVNIAGMLQSGDRFILMEGIQQGRENLNKLRNSVGLPSMPKVWHNIDFDEAKLFPFLDKHFIVKQDIRFGLYDVLTRVFYPAAIYPRQPKYGSKAQANAEKLFYLSDRKAWHEYSREACLVLVRK